ncbi:hypothetical protein Mycch_4258 [Mycolicibacterium chubuense NBB4]|uniref:DUF4185 domain-containing protein n=1 Tax=Mycolicibacterium chubuense (strain NBB4) TaxID=710421 RepID=I4BNW5_MYCCN|nr:DUF4185 domain-containing protein [Mycolicibacterium chubuense]AFM18972.1 hypothetical protein Mycch_4258 [Mycolicibacterium chubuense NBB4]
MSISMIRAQNPQGVVDAGTELSGKAAALDGLIGEQVRAVNRLRQSWFGRAANAAVARAYRDIQRQHLQHELIQARADALSAGGAGMVAGRSVVLAWVAIARSMFDVSDAGVVTPRPPNDTAPWVAIAACYTTIIQQLIQTFLHLDGQLAGTLAAIARGDIPGNDPAPAGGFGPGIDPDGFNNGQLTFHQQMAGFGDAETGAGGVGVPNTDLSIMGMTPDGRMFTIQGDTGVGMNPDTNGGPGARPPDGGNNSILYWKMDEHGKWVVDEVVKNPFPSQLGPGGKADISTIPTSTFNVGDTMYASVMNVDHWNGPPGQRPPGESGWVSRSSELWKSSDNGRTWARTSAVWRNDVDAPNNPFQVQSFAPADDGYVYMYGTADGRTNDGLHMARVPAQYVGDTSQYEYWNGTAFDHNQAQNSSPAVVQTPSGVSGIGEPNVHFYDNKVLLTFNDENGGVYTSSSTDGGVSWTDPTRVVSRGGVYGVFQSPFSGGDSIGATLSLWNPYGTALYEIENQDTRNLGAY